MTNPSLLRLLQLVSPTLPVGAFAYSQGLEYAVEEKWIKDLASCEEWLHGLLQNNIAQLDLPLLVRMQNTLQQQDEAQFQYWNQVALANRETQELRLESLQLGKALLRLLKDMQVDISFLASNQRQQDADWLSAFSLAAYEWEIPLNDTLTGCAWAWLENQVAAAIKLVPLGQTDGQKLLMRLADKIPALVEQAMNISDDNIGALSPVMVIASCKHETQYSRLFRS